MTDALIAQAAFHASLKLLDELKATPVPLAPGVAAKFQAMVPGRNLSELYAEPGAFWHGYAAVMTEFKEVLASAPRAAFVSRKPEKAS